MKETTKENCGQMDRNKVVDGRNDGPNELKIFDSLKPFPRRNFYRVKERKLDDHTVKRSATEKFMQIKGEKCLYVIDHNNTLFAEYFK